MRKIPHWTEEFTPGESIDILRDLALGHCEAAGPYADKIKHLIRRCDFKSVCDLDLDYSDADRGVTPEQFYHCRQALAFFSKLEALDIGIDKEEAALCKFREAEDACRETNAIFKLYARGGFQFHPRVESVLFRAQRKIAEVLGPFPSFETLGYRFGKGATTLTKKRMASVREKFAAGVSCSAELLPAAFAVLGELPVLCEAWASAQMHSEEESWYSIPIVMHEGKLEFVPKNAKTYRATVTEPVLNGLYQLALGDFLVERLAAFGLDLRDQTRNQNLARVGSLTGALATLDLTSASDMLSTELVYSLLPLEWASGLARARTGTILYKGENVVLQKFSSMGNGFTFPLESLIFWALASAVCAKDEVVSVYGDDIILPSVRFTDLVEVLTAVGFKANVKKSFYTGPFRESCGCDFISGVNIRPFYQKNWLSARTLFTLHNYYVRRGMDDFANKVKSFIHPSLVIYGPDGFGDGHLLGEHPRIRKARHDKAGYAGYLFSTFSVLPRKDIRPKHGDFVLPSYSIYRRGGDVELSLPHPLDNEASTTGLGEKIAFYGRYARGHGSMADTLPLKDVQSDEGVTKAVDLPLRDEENSYKRYLIYTLGDPKSETTVRLPLSF